MTTAGNPTRIDETRKGPPTMLIAMILLSVGLAAVAQLALKEGMNQVNAELTPAKFSLNGDSLRVRVAQPFVWGGLVRIFAYQHATFAVNSVCHMFGRRDYASRDESRNNWLVALLVMGEGWHNNHHAFPASARHGLRRWQIDLSWLVIRGLERLGLVWNVRRPTIEQIQRRRLPASADA